MGADAVLSFIQAVGFPAACVIGMAWYVKYITDLHHFETEKLNTQHNQEMNDVKEALNNNTLALQKLTDYIELEGGKNGNNERD